MENDKKIKIAIVNLTGGGMSNGYKKTLTRLVPLLKADPRVTELRNYAPEPVLSLTGLDDVELIAWPKNDRKKGLPVLKQMISEFAPDVVYIPTAAYFDAADIPTAIMVRNMESVRFPMKYSPLKVGIINILRQFLARHACRKADKIIAVSGFVRDYLIKKWKTPAEKFGIVYHGIDIPAEDFEGTKPAALKGDTDEKFWFTAGSIIPYRGLEDVITALVSRPADEKLVIAGESVYSDECKHQCKTLAKDLGVSDRIIWLGHISHDELFWCWKNSIGFVMTSRVEACPNVVLEALAAGSISISTDFEPMPEFYQELAEYYHPGDNDALAGAMQKIAELAPDQRQPLIQAAKTRAKDFSWQRCATRTVDELVSLVEQYNK